MEHASSSSTCFGGFQAMRTSMLMRRQARTKIGVRCQVVCIDARVAVIDNLGQAVLQKASCSPPYQRPTQQRLSELALEFNKSQVLTILSLLVQFAVLSSTSCLICMASC
eukprot:1081638-Amphidinium_carterae.1